MSIPSNHCPDTQIFNDIETKRINTNNRWIKDNITGVLSEPNNTHDISKMASSARLIRTDSPTVERLAAVRAQLNKYITYVSNTISPGQQSTNVVEEISCLSNHDKQSKTNPRASSSQKKTKSQKTLSIRPIEKITYENTSTDNGSSKQKCSVEIWLPNTCTDNDDGIISRTVSADSTTIEKISQSISIKSRRLSTSKILITTENIKINEASSKICEPFVPPYIYQSDKRLRPSKSSNTTKSDNKRSNKTIKRRLTHRPATLTNHTNKTVDISVSSKNPFPDIEQMHSAYKINGSSGSGNSTMVNASTRKYLQRKTNKKPIRAKLQFEKTQQNAKYTNAHLNKDSTSYIPSNHPTLAIKILLGNTSLLRPAGNYHNINKKILNRRLSTYQLSHYDDDLPQTNFISIIDNFQHHRSSTARPLASLPVVASKKTNDLFHSLQSKIPSRLPVQFNSPETISSSSNILQRSTNETEQIPPCVSKQSLQSSRILRSEQQQEHIAAPFLKPIQYQNSAHTSSTDVSTNQIVVHLKYTKR